MPLFDCPVCGRRVDLLGKYTMVLTIVDETRYRTAKENLCKICHAWATWLISKY